jgi:hypothetical protein
VRYPAYIFCPAHHDQCRFSTPKTFQTSGPKFAEPNQILAAPIPPNPMEISVFTISQQHMTREMGDHGLSTNIDHEGVHVESDGSTLEEDIGRGE